MKRVRKSLKVLVVVASVLSAISLLLAYSSTFVSPADQPLIAFFGLAYPLLISLNILSLLFWAVKWSRWTFVPLAVLLIGIPIHGAFFQLFPGSSPETNNQLTLDVMTYNVELFGWYHWKSNIQRRNRLFNQLLDYPADVYCFQEFYYTNIPGRFDTRDTLTKHLNAPHYFDHYTHEMYEVQFYGIATLSRHPIVNSGVIEFPNDKNNVCIYTDIMVSDEIIRVYNGHLCSIRFSGDEHEYVGELKADPGLFEKTKLARMYRRLESAFVKRAWQAELIHDHMKKCPYPIVFCGDFNDTPISYAYGVFDDLLNDTFRSKGSGIGNTYIGNFPSFRIDHIFASDHFKTASHEVLPEKLSDHHGVRARLVLE